MLKNIVLAMVLVAGSIGSASGQITPPQPNKKSNWVHPGIWVSQPQLQYVASQIYGKTLPSTWPGSAAANNAGSEPPYLEAVATMEGSIWGLPYVQNSTKSPSETCYTNTTGTLAYTYPSTCSDILNGLAYSDSYVNDNNAVSVEIPLIATPYFLATAGSSPVASNGPVGYLFAQPTSAPITKNPDYGSGLVFGNSMPVNVAAGQVVCGSGTREEPGTTPVDNTADEIRMGCDEELNAAGAAYTQALLYALTGVQSYAINAMEIMDYYSGYIQNEQGSGALIKPMAPCSVTSVANPTTVYPVPSNLPFPNAWPVTPVLAPIASVPGSGKTPVTNCNVPFAGYVYATYGPTSGMGSGNWNYQTADNLLQANKVFSNAPLEATWAAPQWMAAAEIIRSYVPNVGTSAGSVVPWPGFQSFVDWLDIYYFSPYLSQDSFYDDHNGNWILTLLDTRMSYAVLTENAALYYGTIAEWEESVPAVLYYNPEDSGWRDLAGDTAPSAPFTYPEGPSDTSSQSVNDGYGWNGQVFWGAAQNGIGQEICRDGAHAQYSLSASASTAETAFIQGDPQVYTSQANRLQSALEFQSSIQSASIAESGVSNVTQSSGTAISVTSLRVGTTAPFTNDCSGTAARVQNKYDPILKGSMEKGYTELASRLAMPLPNTITYLINSVRPVADTLDWGNFVSPTKEGPNNQIAEDRMGVFWETATNASGSSVTVGSSGSPTTPAPAYSGPSWSTLQSIAPSSLAAAASTAASANQVSLVWVSNDSSAIGYNLYRNHVLIANTSAPSYTDTGVVGGMTYDYQVYAVDSSIGQSAGSNALFVTTPVGPSPQIAVLEAPPSYETVSLPPGSTAARMSTIYTLNITPSGNFPSGALGSISLSASGGPTGAGGSSEATFSFCAPAVANGALTLAPPCSTPIGFDTAIPTSLGVSILTVTVPAGAPAGTYPLTIVASGDGATGTTTVPLTIGTGGSVASPTVSVSPNAVSIAQGGSSSPITINVSGFTGSATLTATSLPTGVTSSLSPSSTTGTSTLTLTASSAATAGTTAVTITATAGSQTASTTLNLTVAPPVTPSFTLSSSPSSLSVAQGASGNSTISVTDVGGFSGSVNLLVTSPLPTGVTAAFSQGSTNGTSTLTLTAGSAATPGQVTVTVTGTSGSQTATTTVTLTVTSAAFSCGIEYTITKSWSNGFSAALTIYNNSATAIGSWTLAWAFSNGQTITSAWDVGSESQSGANVTLTNASYNGKIAAESSISGVGFNATLNSSGNPEPAAFTLNGTPCN
jgi:Cellulose binding domain